MKSVLMVSLISILGISCSSVPKGEYSRTKIERPYSLPDDVAKTSIGATTVATEITEADDEVANDDETSGGSTPTLLFENGISKNVSWIYPLGLKWGIYSDESHTVGFSFASLFIITTYSFDYWFKLSEKISLRPYTRYSLIDIFFIRDERRYNGAEVLYQLNEKLALNTFYHIGTYSGKSEFIEAVVTGLTGSDDIDTEVTGTIAGGGFGVHYSISDKWDFDSSIQFETLEVDSFTTSSTQLKFDFGYLY